MQRSSIRLSNTPIFVNSSHALVAQHPYANYLNTCRFLSCFIMYYSCECAYLSFIFITINASYYFLFKLWL